MDDTAMNTRDKLIQSAAELMWAQGYSNTSPKDIQKAAGVGQGSMYHHFGGKSELAVAALHQSAEHMKSIAGTEFASPQAPLDRLRSYLMLDREVLRGCRIGRMTQDAAVTDDADLRQPVAETLAWLVAQLQALLTEAQEAGDLNPSLDCADTATSVAAALQGGYVLARAEQSPEPFERAIRGVLALIDLASINKK